MYSIVDGVILKDGKPLTKEDRVRLCVCTNIFGPYSDPVLLMKQMRSVVKASVLMPKLGVPVGAGLEVMQLAFETFNLGD